MSEANPTGGLRVLGQLRTLLSGLVLPLLDAVKPGAADPRGKGIFITTLRRTGTPEELVHDMKDAGIEWVAIELMWQNRGERPRLHNTSTLARYAKALDDAGIRVWLWLFPGLEVEPVREAIRRGWRDAPMADGLIVDAEKPLYATSDEERPAMVAKAKEITAAVLEELPRGKRTALTSYSLPALHPRFPWEGFAGLKLGIGQVYSDFGEDYAPNSKRQYLAKGFKKWIPALGASNNKTPELMRKLLGWALRTKPRAVIWWSHRNAYANQLRVAEISKAKVR